MNVDSSNGSFSGNPLREVVLENALDAVVAMDSQNIIIDWNKQAERIFGWCKEEVLGKRLAEILVPPDFRNAHREGLERFLSTGVGPILNSRVEVFALKSDGSRFPVELTVIPVNLQGTYIFYSFVRDITEKRRSEKELLLRSEVLEHSLNGIDIVDETGKFIYANSAYLRMWGYENLDEIKGSSPVSHCADPDIPARIICQLKAAGECDIEFVARRKDGSLFDVRMWARLVLDPEGREIYPTTSIDITEQKRSREALRRSEELYHTTFSKAPVGILNTAPDGKLMNINDKFCEMLGYSREELKAVTFVQLTHPDDQALDQILFNELKQGHLAIYDREKRYLRKDGSVLWVHVTAELLRDSEGIPTHSVTIVRDISDRKMAEEKKTILEARLRLLSELSRDLLEEPLGYNERLQKFVKTVVPHLADWCAVDIIDMEGGLKLAAVAHQDESKVRLAIELRKKFPHKDRNAGPFKVIKTRESELVSRLDAQILQNISINAEHLEILTSLGMKSYLCVPIVAHGDVLGALTMVSEKKQYNDSDLRFAEDLATRAALALYNSTLYMNAKEAIQARDEFLSIASHELKTPLTTLKLQAQIQSRLQQNASPEAFSHERIAANNEKIERLVNHLDRLVDDMLDISRIRTGKLTVNKERANLVNVTREIIDRMQAPYLAAKADPIQFVAPIEAICQIDVMRMEQVISNLLQNALKYGQGKNVRVDIKNNDQFLSLSVTDSGMGISEENQTKIFERFERGIDPHKISGLGLGLYISQQIIKAHGGTIRVTSQLGQGSNFELRLPNV